MSLLMPDVGLLFWMTLSFGTVFFVLARFGFPVIMRAVDERNRKINDSLEAARRAEERLAGLDAEAGEIIRKARAESGEILARAEQTRAGIVEAARREAERQAKLTVERAQAEIEASKRKALGEIRTHVAELSVKIASAVLGETLSVDGRQQKLIERLMDESITHDNGQGAGI